MPFVCLVPTGAQEEVSDLLELELQMVMSLQEGTKD